MTVRYALVLAALLILTLPLKLSANDEFEYAYQASEKLKAHSSFVDLDNSLYFTFPFGTPRDHIVSKIGNPSSELRNYNATLLFYGGDVGFVFKNGKLYEVILGKPLVSTPVDSQIFSKLTYSPTYKFWKLKEGITNNSSLKDTLRIFPGLKKRCRDTYWQITKADYTAYFWFHPNNEPHDRQFLEKVRITNENYGTPNNCEDEKTYSLYAGMRFLVTALDQRDRFFGGQQVFQLYLENMSKGKCHHLPPISDKGYKKEICDSPNSITLNISKNKNITKNILGRYYELSHTILYNEQKNDTVYNFSEIFTEWTPPNGDFATIFRDCPEGGRSQTKEFSGFIRLFSNDFSWIREFDPDSEQKIHHQRINRIVSEYQGSKYHSPIGQVEYEVISSYFLCGHKSDQPCDAKTGRTILISSDTVSSPKIWEYPVYKFTGNAITIEDYIKKNLKPYRFDNSFDTCLNIHLTSPKSDSKEDYKLWRDRLLQLHNNPTIIYFSRVGLNSNNTEAVFSVSYKNLKFLRGSGKLFYLRKQNGKWKIMTSIRSWIS